MGGMSSEGAVMEVAKMTERTIRTAQRATIGATFACFVLLGCSSELLRHYEAKSTVDVEKDEPKLVEVSVFVTDQPAKAPKKIQSLGDRGQAALIYS